MSRFRRLPLGARSGRAAPATAGTETLGGRPVAGGHGRDALGARLAGNGRPPAGAARPLPAGRHHIDSLAVALGGLYAEAERLDGWGCRLARVLAGGGRVLVAGNGGSAAQAQHLTAELVGRYRDDRPPFSAIALCAEASAVTAIGNDYGAEEVFARQVRAHGRAGDVLVALSTSGRSPNVLAAVAAATAAGMTTWALTGPRGNPLAERCDDALCVGSPHAATVQEVHLVAVHLVCAAFDHAIERAAPGVAG